MSTIELSVVVPSHDRQLRLRWLLNALEEQTLERSRFEVIVVHDYSDYDAEQIIERHPLAAKGVLSHLRVPGESGPSRKRNLGWMEGKGAIVAFTDDDCRPHSTWLAELSEAAKRHPGSILQGRTRPDPLEEEVFAAPHHRSLHVDPPTPYAQTCNIAYPRELLERVGGFDESLPTAAGEDTDLALRARSAGAEYVGVGDALVFHAVEAYSLRKMIGLNQRWQHLPLVVREHPELRDLLQLGVFWKQSHCDVLLATAGLLLIRRQPFGALLVLPYVMSALGRRGRGRRRRLTAALELPGQAIVDAAEVVTLARGSIRYRTLVL